MAIHFLTVLCLIMMIVLIALTVAHASSISRSKSRIREVEAHAEKVEQSRNELMANLSHELRTPINTIMGMSELLSDDNFDSQTRGQIQAIQSTGRELLSKISDLLDYAQFSSDDEIKIQEEPYRIASTLSDVVSDYLDTISAKDIELIIDLDASVPEEMIGDEPKIRRVMMNILSNAVKFTNSGCIAIHLSARKEQYGVNLRFEVRDTGKGMKQEEINSLFKAFYQGDSSYTRSVGGIGLGLAISFAMIRSMGGFLTVSSEVDKGSRVAFAIPQKVRMDRSIYCVEAKGLKPVVFVNFEKYKNPVVREEYRESILNMATNSGLPLQECRTITELKRFKPGRNITHLVVGLEEYLENETVVDELRDLIPIIVFVPRGYQLPARPNLYAVYKPFYGLTLANLLNGNGCIDPFAGPLREGDRFKAPGVRALVVDDNRMNLRVMKGLLKKYDIETDTALGGFEAIRMLDVKRFDFIFMDHMMPEMDGVETLRRIRQRPDLYSKEVPVIAVSANAIGNAKDRYLNEGFMDYIPKPIDKLTLDSVLRKLIPAARRVAADAGEPMIGEPSLRVEPVMEAAEPTPEAANADTEMAEQIENEDKCDMSTEKTDMIPVIPVQDAPQIDMEQALVYCGDDMELFFEIADSYIENYAEKREVIHKLYLEEDWKNYAIEVHALKSTSRTIGAMELGDRAERLEKAAKEVMGMDNVTGTGGLSTIHAEHAYCIALYDVMIAKLGDLKK